ncbi:biotin carboxylase N-terminal domain-containing protein [Carboxylicivirga sp. M1479]|uniref:acetyl/propionyl/methylcrotonyl-CoA carboxylase subunit alpha n=2 Tax=Carboxylicivirga TaxID=1628153 RepID=UPI00163DB591|nr:biotin carboxylase N-terminal domain-containing protein [Carboxylicivirga sp. M1479]
MRKVLIPNRGEIAVRIIKAAHELELSTLVLLSELEKDTLPAQLSDEVHFFKDGPFEDNYLNIPLIIELAKQYDADSIHPGYGFLSESHLLAKACLANKLIFIGPSVINLQQMGDKQVARTIAREAGIPLTQSWQGKLQTILSEADSLSYPVLVKAAMGGGGKGMQVCNSKDDLVLQLPILSKQAQRYFGDDRLYVEQYIAKARHIEVQVLADHTGKTIHLYERECSIQRRFQKIIEEAPAHNLPDAIKQRLYADALKICQTIGYKSAGTIEFLVDEKGQHYFLEMNTRIQVEHCVTEEVTGIDLVKWQFLIANQKPLTLQQEDVPLLGHAIELRICAEDPNNNFQPKPGKIQALLLPKSNEARIEIGFLEAIEIHSQFDPMLAKIIVHASNRDKAVEKALKANHQLIIQGLKTNAGFINNILKHKTFSKAAVDTRFCENNLDELTSNNDHSSLIAMAYLAYRHKKLQNRFWRQLQQFRFSLSAKELSASVSQHGEEISILLQNQTYDLNGITLSNHTLEFTYKQQVHQFYCFEEDDKVEIIHQNNSNIVTVHDWLPPYKPAENKESTFNGNKYLAPIPSQVMKVNIENGQKVKKGDLLLVLEAMKTENHIKAWKDGTIKAVYIAAGQQVKLNQTLLKYQ